MSKIKFVPMLLLLFLGLISVSANAQNRIERALIAEAEKYSGDRFMFDATTKLGAKVYGVREPSQKMLDSIDQGLKDLFAIAKLNGYYRRLNYSDYSVFIAKADRTKDYRNLYSPDIAVGAAQYAGTVYDQGGYVYAAGMVISLNYPAFIIAEHDKNYERVAEVVRYEGEHLVLYHNDRKRFEATRDHSQGGGHPILK